MSSIIREINQLATNVGSPGADLTILAEGNAAVLDSASDRFLVKASGVVMGEARESDWVWVSYSKTLEILEEAAKTGYQQKLEDALNQILKSATTDSGEIRKASIETLVHAVAFNLFGAVWSLHTHPTPVVALASSLKAEEHFAGSVFPDESVLCGPIPLFVPYAEPGLSLGLALFSASRDYIKRYGRSPGEIILGNHGLCTYGKVSQEALATTEMAVKASRVRIGAMSAGGINFIPNNEAEKIAFRPDEVARRKDLTQGL